MREPRHFLEVNALLGQAAPSGDLRPLSRGQTVGDRPKWSDRLRQSQRPARHSGPVSLSMISAGTPAKLLDTKYFGLVSIQCLRVISSNLPPRLRR